MKNTVSMSLMIFIITSGCTGPGGLFSEDEPDLVPFEFDLTIEDLRRIDRIVQKAKFSVVAKHSISFLFKTIGVGVSELALAFIGATKSANLTRSSVETEEHKNERVDNA